MYVYEPFAHGFKVCKGIRTALHGLLNIQRGIQRLPRRFRKTGNKVRMIVMRPMHIFPCKAHASLPAGSAQFLCYGGKMRVIGVMLYIAYLRRPVQDIVFCTKLRPDIKHTAKNVHGIAFLPFVP